MTTVSSGNYGVTYDSNNLSAYINSAQLQAAVNAMDSTNAASTTSTTKGGLLTTSLQIGGDWSKAVDDIIGPDADTPPATLKPLIVTLGTGDELVTRTWSPGTASYGAWISNYQITSGTADKMAWTATLNINGKPVRS